MLLLCRLDASRPVELGNIVCLHNFFGGVDEEWFRLIHVAIEARAAETVSAIPAAQVLVPTSSGCTVRA